MKTLQKPIQIIGIKLRTTNDNAQAFIDIPSFWQRFMSENMVAQIPNKSNNDIYGIYTDFENAGKNNHGMYSLIIGCEVAANTLPPAGFTAVTIPAGHYRVFPVEKGRQDKVGEAWQAIWALPASDKKTWTFTCEFERYRATGEIDIFIGTKE